MVEEVVFGIWGISMNLVERERMSLRVKEKSYIYGGERRGPVGRCRPRSGCRSGQFQQPTNEQRQPALGREGTSYINEPTTLVRRCMMRLLGHRQIKITCTCNSVLFHRKPTRPVISRGEECTAPDSERTQFETANSLPASEPLTLRETLSRRQTISSVDRRL